MAVAVCRRASLEDVAIQEDSSFPRLALVLLGRREKRVGRLILVGSGQLSNS